MVRQDWASAGYFFTIGRSANPASGFTGTMADWDRNGGINAFGFMADQANNYDFINSSVSNIVVDDQGAFLSVTAAHSFSLNVDGTPTTLDGNIVTTFLKDETPDSVGYTRGAVGTLSSPQGWSFTIDYSQMISGLHTNNLSSVTNTEVTYIENGQPFPFSCSVTKSLTRTGDQTWMLIDDRIGENHGGAGPKNSHAETRFTRTSDGKVATSFELIRDMPLGPPEPGQTGTIEYQQRMFVDTVSTGVDDLGGYVRRRSRS